MTAEPELDAVALPTRRATKHLARALARAVLPGDALILTGGLGAGKTFLVRALCRALGLSEQVRVVSPTFTLVRELQTTPQIAHADLYRLATPDEAFQLGLLELRERGYVLLVEWGERCPEALGPDRLVVTLETEPRRARFTASGPRSELLRAQLARGSVRSPT